MSHFKNVGSLLKKQKELLEQQVDLKDGLAYYSKRKLLKPTMISLIKLKNPPLDPRKTKIERQPTERG